MEEEKKLTLEEMKSLVSVSEVLPALLEKIAKIEKRIDSLSDAFLDLKEKYNEAIGAITDYKTSVDESVKEFQLVPKEFEIITGKLDALDKKVSGLMEKETEAKPSKKDADHKIEKPIKKEEKPKEEDPDKEIVERIIERLLKDHLGRKTRILTSIQIKQLGNCDDEVAEKVIQRLVNKKLYNRETRTLKFPARNGK